MHCIIFVTHEYNLLLPKKESDELSHNIILWKGLVLRSRETRLAKYTKRETNLELKHVPYLKKDLDNANNMSCIRAV